MPLEFGEPAARSGPGVTGVPGTGSPRILPSHATMNQFSAVNGELTVGGFTLTELAARAGQTPFYVYDQGLICHRVEALRQQLPPGIHVHYAMKANPMSAVVALLARGESAVDGIDVASGGELAVALAQGADPQHISFAGPGKRDGELRLAVEAGILVNAESAREVAALAHIAATLGKSARVALRVNPDFELKASGMKMGGGAKPFGIDVDQIPAVLAQIAAHSTAKTLTGDPTARLPEPAATGTHAGLRFEGFQIFAGSQSLNAQAIVQAQQNGYALALRLAAQAAGCGLKVTTLNLGGGFGIPYFPGESRLDLTPIAANLQALLARAKTELPQAQLVLELGRYLVGEAGLYVTRVVDRKTSAGQVFLVTDGGMHHHLAASGNFGQVVRKNYPVTVGNRLDSPLRERASVVGPLCTPLDLLADRMEMPVAQVGDFVVVYQSGAYGLSASPRGFLGHPDCVELLV